MILLLLAFFATVSSLRLAQLPEPEPGKLIKWSNAQSTNIKIIKSIHVAMVGNNNTLGAFDTEPDKEVFCFAFIRSPAEPTAVMLANQLNKGCDGYGLFSHKAFTLGKHKVIKAFSDRDRKEALQYHMHEMILGAWTQMAEMGVLGKYRWYVKLDGDSFVQSSVVRKTFSRYSQQAQDHPKDPPTIISTGWSSSTPHDGFLVGVPNTLLKKIYAFNMKESVGNKVRVCDEFFTGHFFKQYPDTNKKLCVEQVGMFLVSPPQDENQNLLLAMDQEKHLDDLSFSGCHQIGQKLLAHFATWSEPLCSCIPSDSKRGKQCYPIGFLTTHPVKDPDVYEKLVHMFP